MSGIVGREIGGRTGSNCASVRRAWFGGYDNRHRNSIKSSGDSGTAPKHEEGDKAVCGGGGGGGGFDASALHPFIQGLLKTLPAKEGADWPIKDRVKWLRLAASAFDMIYEGDGSISIKANESAD